LNGSGGGALVSGWVGMAQALNNAATLSAANVARPGRRPREPDGANRGAVDGAIRAANNGAKTVATRGASSAATRRARRRAEDVGNMASVLFKLAKA
jgi:hypothetical protein